MNSHPPYLRPTQVHDCVGQVLNHALADEFALALAARDYQWNVAGPQFRNLHELFGEQYHALDRWIERIVERARMLGVPVCTGWSELIRAPRFAPTRGADLTATAMMEQLIELHSVMAQQLTADADVCATKCGDAFTAEMLRELAEYHETTGWMLGELRSDRELAEA